MTDDELRARERELADELFHLRLRRATSQLANPMKVRETKRDLARVKTVLQQRTPTSAPAETPSQPTAATTPTKRSRPTRSGAIASKAPTKRTSTGRPSRKARSK